MKTDLKLVAGGLAGVLTVAALVVGLLAWGTAPVGEAGGQLATLGAPDAPEPTGPTSPEPAGHEEDTPRAPMPSMEAQLAAAHRSASAGGVADRAATGVAAGSARRGAAPTRPEVALADGPVRLRRLVVARGVSGREPLDPGDVVTASAGRVYAFAEAVNETGEAVALRVTFEPARGESVGHVALEVPANAPRWRTWAWTRHVTEPGAWEVVVRGPDGRVLGRRAFDVVP